MIEYDETDEQAVLEAAVQSALDAACLDIQNFLDPNSEQSKYMGCHADQFFDVNDEIKGILLHSLANYLRAAKAHLKRIE